MVQKETPCRASGNNSSRHTRRGPFYRVYGNLLFNLTKLVLAAGHAWYRTIVLPSTAAAR